MVALCIHTNPTTHTRTQQTTSNEVKHCVSTPNIQLPPSNSIDNTAAARHIGKVWRTILCERAVSLFMYVATTCLERLNVCDCESSWNTRAAYTICMYIYIYWMRVNGHCALMYFRPYICYRVDTHTSAQCFRV